MNHAQATRDGLQLARPAPAGPILPHRVASPYCRECGASGPCWLGEHERVQVAPSATMSCTPHENGVIPAPLATAAGDRDQKEHRRFP